MAVTAWRSDGVGGYLVAVAATAGMVLLRWLMDPSLGNNLPLALLYGAVAFAVWFGGYRPAVLAVVLGYFACSYLFIEPRGTLGFPEFHNLIGLILYLFSCAIIVTLGEALRVTRHRADEQRESLRITLISMGDAVIATDAEGRVTSLNPVAEALTGWTQDEAAGRSLEEVFCIVNEQTRKSVENPVNRVLAKGRTVGLANHTTLIAKDGTERPIDDSAAPIKNAHGHVLGVVLIFRDVTERRQAEKAARSLAAIVESSEDAIIGKDMNGIITSWNQAAERLYGYSTAEAVGRPIAMLAPPDRADEMPAILARLKQGERIHHFDTIRRTKDGRLVPVSLTVSPIKDEDGEVVGASKIARDISERAQAEEELREEKARLHATLTGIGDAVIVTDAENRITLMNPVAQALTGWKEEAAGRPLEEVFRIINEQTRQPVQSPVSRVMREGTVVGLANHTILIAKDGTELPIDDSAAPIRDSQGRMIGCVLVFRDIAERRQAEQKRADDAGRIASVLNTVIDGIITIDESGTVETFNPSAEKLFGYKAEEVVGRNVMMLMPEPYRSEHDGYLANYLQTGQAKIIGIGREVEGCRKDGSTFPMELAVAEFRLGERRYFTGVVRDITERKQAERVLRESEALLRQLADNMAQIVWTAGPDGNIDYLNRRWAEFTGLPQTVSNDAWGQILHPDDAHPASERWTNCLSSSTPFDMEIRLLDPGRQSYRWHLIRTVPVHDEAGKVIRWFGTGTDIHEQKRLEESAHFLAGASAELASVVDYKSTLQKIAGLAVPHFADWSAVDLANDDGSLRRLAVAHQDPDKIALVHQLMLEYPPDPHSSGGAYAVLRTGKPEILSDIPDELLEQAMKDERHLHLIRSLGLKSYICAPLIVSGNVLGVLTFATAESGRRYTQADLALAVDLASRASVAIENNQLFQALRDADRRKDEFLATLAHELRNPLAPLRNALELLRRGRDNAALSEQARTMMERQVSQMVRLVDDLLDVSRITQGKVQLRRERMQLAAVIQSAVESSRPFIEAHDQELIVTLPPESIYLDADPARLNQVFANLLNNAAKFSMRGAHIWLTAELHDGEIVVSVRDTGIGIPGEHLPRIFEMFSQVEPVLERSQGGLGIGLFLVRRIVELHGGSIEARSAGIGRGSEFAIHLPAVEIQVPTPLASEDSDKENSGVRLSRILVVDDNRDSADSLAMMLQLTGHETNTAYDGLEAVQVAATFRPQVVLLDIGLPKVNGYETARLIREEPWGKGIALIALTGWGQEEDERRSIEAGFDRHLTKPVEPAALEELLARMNPVRQE